jgi:eukaryotic-like serine/threonine-protein kinase
MRKITLAVSFVTIALIFVFSFSAGNYAQSTESGPPRRSLVWVKSDGTEQQIDASPHAYRSPRISPDGVRIAVSIEEQGGQIWIYDVNSGSLVQFTTEGSNNLYPMWTPDGQHIAFESDNPTSPGNLLWQSTRENSKAERLIPSKNAEAPSGWSPDGRLLAFWEASPQTSRDIWIFSLDDHQRHLFLQTSSSEAAARFSPDSKWLAYTSNESGRPEIYIRPYPGPGDKQQISNNGGTEPLWSSDGRQIFYREGDAKMMSAGVAKGRADGSPNVLFEGHYLLNPAGTAANYDVARDGRFLMIEAAQ